MDTEAKYRKKDCMIKKIISHLTKPKRLLEEKGKLITKGENSFYSWTTEWSQDRIGNWFVINVDSEEKKYE